MLLSFLLAYFGFAALSLSKTRHFQQVWPDQKIKDTTAKILPTLGWTLLASSSLFIFQGPKVSIAIAEWLGTLTISAMLLILQFSYLPQSVAGVVWINAIRKIFASSKNSHQQN